MNFRTLHDDDEESLKETSSPSWVEADPSGEMCAAEASPSGVNEVTADDTTEAPEAHRPALQTATADATQESVESDYRQEGNWQALAHLFEERISASNGREKVELLKRLGEVLWKELRDADGARAALVEAMALDPLDDEAASLAADVAASTPRGWSALVKALGQTVRHAKTGAEKAKLAERIVRWAREDMNDPATVDQYMAVVRTHDPFHAFAHQRLADEYARSGAYDAQRESLDRALARADRDADRVAIYVSFGELYEKHIPNRKLAVDNYETALRIDPRSMGALSGVERICRAEEQYQRLADVLDRQVDAARNDKDRVGALVRLGELLERRFVKPREAAPKFELALELEGSCVPALDGLERCWHALRDWDRLAAALDRRASAASDPREARAILERLAEVQEAKQDNVDLALACWRRIYELDTSYVTAITELARLCEKTGDFHGASGYRTRLADLATDPKAKARIHLAIGEALVPAERDPESARYHFERAVEIDPRNTQAWEGLQKLAMCERDTMYAIFCLERRAENTDSPRLKGHLLVELAELRTSLGDAQGALSTFARAFEADPLNETAAGAVLDDWSQREKWVDAQKACDVLLNAASRDNDHQALLKLLGLAGRIALAVGNGERALMAMEAAYDLAPTDSEVRTQALLTCHGLREQGALRDRLSSLAASIAQNVSDLSPEWLVRLGEVRLAVGDAEGGTETLRLALSRQRDNRDALAALYRAFTQGRDFRRAANCLHRLARLAEDPRERRGHLLEAAEVWIKSAQEPSQASAVLEEALEHDPKDAGVLQRLVALRSSLGEWEKLLDALNRLGDIENDPKQRAKQAYACADVAREKIGDAKRAAALYEKVLELDHSRLEAFEHIVRIWTEQRDWGELEHAYRRMIDRVHSTHDERLEHALYRQLGLLYRDRISNVPRALDTFRCAARIAPEDEEVRRIIVELLLLSGEPELAIADLRQYLGTDATRPSTLNELYDLYLREGMNDSAWCAANALVHLGEADETQRKFVTDFPPLDVADVPGTLAARAWSSHLMAKGLDERLTAVFRHFVPAVVRSRTPPVPETSGSPWLGQQLREQDSPLAARIAQLVRDAAEILGVPTPVLLLRPNLNVAFTVAATPTPTLFVSLPAAEAVPPQLLVYLVARRLAALKPELLAHALYPALGELKDLLKLALRIATTPPNELAPWGEDATVAQALQPNELESLRSAVTSLLGHEKRADVRGWQREADLSIARAALLLTGDFELAWHGMHCEARSPSDLSPSEWRTEMIQFAVSDEHVELREAIGVGIQARGR